MNLEFVTIEGKKKIVTIEALVMPKSLYNLVNMDALVDEQKIGSWQGPDGAYFLDTKTGKKMHVTSRVDKGVKNSDIGSTARSSTNQ